MNPDYIKMLLTNGCSRALLNGPYKTDEDFLRYLPRPEWTCEELVGYSGSRMVYVNQEKDIVLTFMGAR